MIYYACLFVAILIGVGGQLALKAGSMNTASSVSLGFLQPYIILGLGCYFLSALFYIYSLKHIPVSVAFPCVSLSYVAVAFLAHVLWNEPFGLQHMIALAFILLGVSLLVKA